jgi:hypothetical protein
MATSKVTFRFHGRLSSHSFPSLERSPAKEPAEPILLGVGERVQHAER